MFIGGSAGSTAGGFKVIRAMIIAKIARNQTLASLYPNRILSLHINGSVLDKETQHSVLKNNLPIASFAHPHATRGTSGLISKEVTHHALGAQRLPPDVALRTIDPGLQAHRNLLDLRGIELGGKGKQSMGKSIQHDGDSLDIYIGTRPSN